ncbi:hypothetical protein ACFWR6_07130 [Streptomyces griseus]|uniref:hypothetical protein n=1 Tax=Streptomyces griseus TaxID=1911 RepID=UPI00364FB6FE
MPALVPARLTEIRDLVADLATHRADPPPDPAQLLARCEKALTDVLSDRAGLLSDLGEAAEELATWTGTV